MIEEDELTFSVSTDMVLNTEMAMSQKEEIVYNAQISLSKG